MSTRSVQPPVRARHIMSREVLTVELASSIDALVALLRANHVTGVAVVNERGILVGVISETDLVDQDGEAQASGGERPRSVSDAYSPYVVTAGPSATLVDLAAKMVRHRVHRLFIVESGKLVGVVTSMDIMRALAASRARARRTHAKVRA
jgi:CBS domain-containing protein